MRQTFILMVALALLFGCTRATNARKLKPAVNLYKAGRYQEAQREFTKYLSAYPTDSFAWVISGHNYNMLNKSKEAEEAYKTALNINPQQFKALEGMAILKRKAGKLEEAIKFYKEALEVQPTAPQIHTSLGVIYLKQKKDKQGLEYAKKAYQYDKKDPVIAANLAIAYHFNKMYKERDKIYLVAEKLGYRNLTNLKLIFKGHKKIR